MRVLIAEDEALIRLDLREMLLDAGYEVVGEAGDGERAVALAREVRPDLVVMDVRMPVMDGITAAETIVAERIAPVVVVTAVSDREQVERARSAGVMGYLVKPFQPHDLVPAIEMARSRFEEMAALSAEVRSLGEALESRKLVDRARSILMTRHGLTEPAAFAFIQRAAMDHRTTMRAVAESIIAGQE